MLVMSVATSKVQRRVEGHASTNDQCGCAVVRCSRTAGAATAVLGVGTVLQLAVAGYLLGGRATSLMAVAWHGDALMAVLLAAVAWYLSFSVVRGFDGHVLAFASCGAAWMAGMLALWLPELCRLAGPGGSARLQEQRTSDGRHGVPQVTQQPAWLAVMQRCLRVVEAQQGRIRICMAVAPAVAVVVCMPVQTSW